MSSGYSSAPAETSTLRVEKSRTEAVLTLSNGSLVRGAFFIAGNSATHEGPERVKDVLNAEPGCFPFEVTVSGGPHTVLYNRDHVVFVALPDSNEAHLDPGYDVATKRSVFMLLTNGSRLKGVVTVYLPQGRDRLSDFARSRENFRYLETPAVTYLVNVRHLIELAEETTNS